jgi:hypothetical protein
MSEPSRSSTLPKANQKLEWRLPRAMLAAKFVREQARAVMMPMRARRVTCRSVMADEVRVAGDAERASRALE